MTQAPSETHPIASTDDRAVLRSLWLDQVVTTRVGPLLAASADAGFRSYWRANTARGSVIVMDSPPGLEDLQPWLRMRKVLAAGGVRVPALLACDEGLGFAMLEDLGAETYLHRLNEDSADALFEAAIGQLLRLQSIQVPAGLGRYDRALLQRELDLFPDWFVHRHLGLDLDADTRSQLHALNERLIERALAQPQVLVHRDYMPRNLMPVDDGPAVLDFQDAVYGPIAYDPISLFRDAFVSWPAARVDDWLRRYHQQAFSAGLPVPAWPQFRDDADWIGVQRHLKVLGIFARLCHRDGKPRYIADAERFLGYLEQVAARHRELAVLSGLIDREIRPALARIETTGNPAASADPSQATSAPESGQ